MPRSAPSQLNVRSTFARERVRELSARTGMSATRVVEEALRNYSPLVDIELAREDGLVLEHGILVWVGNGRTYSVEDVQLAIDSARDDDFDD